jgi:2-methylaconitate isomerase
MEDAAMPQRWVPAVFMRGGTSKGLFFHARFAVRDGRAETRGELSIPGVAGTGSPVRLDFLDPGGARTGRLLPTGRPVDEVELGGAGRFRLSLVDAAAPVAFVAAADHDGGVRMLSMERAHRAVPVTGALCLGVACRVPGTVAHAVAAAPDPVRVGNPSGVVRVAAEVAEAAGGWRAGSASLYRTARSLMRGAVAVPPG